MADCREGLIFCLLGSDRPIHESFSPRLIGQREAMSNQIDGMTDIPFTYKKFEETRSKLISEVNQLMTESDKRFLVSFEKSKPEWESYEKECRNRLMTKAYNKRLLPIKPILYIFQSNTNL